MNKNNPLYLPLRWAIILPNLPFLVILAIYVMYNMYKHTGPVEMEFAKEKEELLTPEIKKHINEIYPWHFMAFVAGVFYLWVGWLLV